MVTQMQVLCDWLDPEGNKYFQLETLEVFLSQDGYVYFSAAGGPDLARYKLSELEEQG